MKITVVGMGYVGLSNGILLAQHNEVKILDIEKEKIQLLNNGKSPIVDKEISEYLSEKKLNLKGTLDKKYAYKNADYIIIAVPTNYNKEKKSLDTEIIENIIKDILEIEYKSTIIIKSTVPVGYTEKIKRKFGIKNIIFSPEFLREGQALYDNLYPNRIIMGEKSKIAEQFVELLLNGGIKKDVPVLYMTSTEAEAVKLFSNTYLALRIAYFNELDTYAELRNLNSGNIIEGVSSDPRIGNYYNNPSFGYGGYCLPKDTKELMDDYKYIPNNLIKAVVDSNKTRKSHIVKMILEKNPKTVGIYRLIMKKGSDNLRTSSMKGIIKRLKEENVKIYIYEPILQENYYKNLKVIKSLEEFKKISEIIVTNRFHEDLEDVKIKVYTRDIYRRD